MHQTSKAYKVWHKFTYFIGFASGRGQMAPQRPLEMVKNSGKISGLTEEDEILCACRACQDKHICHKEFLSDQQEAHYFLLKFQNKAISGIGI